MYLIEPQSASACFTAIASSFPLLKESARKSLSDSYLIACFFSLLFSLGLVRTIAIPVTALDCLPYTATQDRSSPWWSSHAAFKEESAVTLGSQGQVELIESPPLADRFDFVYGDAGGGE